MQLNPQNLLYQLPDPMLISILGYLPVEDLLQVAAVDRRLYQIANDNIFWKTIFQGTYPAPDNPAFIANWKQRTLIWHQFAIAKIVKQLFTLQTNLILHITPTIVSNAVSINGKVYPNCKLYSYTGSVNTNVYLVDRERLYRDWEYKSTANATKLNYFLINKFSVWQDVQYTKIDVNWRYHRITIQEENSSEYQLKLATDITLCKDGHWLKWVALEVNFLLKNKSQQILQHAYEYNLAFLSSLSLKIFSTPHRFSLDSQACIMATAKDGSIVDNHYVSSKKFSISIVSIRYSGHLIPSWTLLNSPQESAERCTYIAMMDRVINAWTKRLGITITATES